MEFPNKCEACSHMNGIINPKGEPWSGDIRVDCELGVRSTIEQGCSQFVPNILGCSSRCYYYNDKNCNKGHDITLAHKCLDYSVIDYIDDSKPTNPNEALFKQNEFLEKHYSDLSYTEKEIQDIISLYKKYIQEKINLALNDDDKLNASIHLTTSSINASSDVIKIMGNIDNTISKYSYDTAIDLKTLQENKDLYKIHKAVELFNHEIVHLVQKHIYTSLYEYVVAVQEIEFSEINILKDFLSEGHTFNAYTDFMQSIHEFLKEKNGFELYSYYNSIKLNAQIALRATKKFDNQLTFLHLIESQALYISRLFLGINNFIPPKNTLYTLAWHEFEKNGGTNPKVFVLILDASLRYGGLKTDMPHPVEIFNFLISLSTELEEIFNVIENELTYPKLQIRSSAFGRLLLKSSNLFSLNESEDSDDFKEIEDRLSKLVSHCINVSNDNLIKPTDDYAFDLEQNPDLNHDYQKKISKISDRYFKNRNYIDTEEDVCLLFCKQILEILKAKMYNVEDSIDNVQNFYKDHMMHNIAYSFINHFPNYKNIEFIFSFFIMNERNSDSYNQFWQFLTELRSIKVGLYNEMEYFQYEEILKYPELIKSILALNSDEVSPSNGIYCCQKHSYLSPTNMNINQLFDELDSCTEVNSISRQLCEIFNKESILDFFNFD